MGPLQLSYAPLAQTSSYVTAGSSATKLNYSTTSSRKLSLLISISFVVIKQSLKNTSKTRLWICIYKTSFTHRPNDYIGFASNCPPPTFYNKIAPTIKLQYIKWYRRRGANAPPKFWFVENLSNIFKNLDKNSAQRCLISKNGTHHFAKNTWRCFLEVIPKKGLHNLWSLWRNFADKLP